MTIENKDAIELIAYHDTAETLYYVDPPYLAETRTAFRGKGSYRHEMDDDQHRALLDLLLSLKGMVIVSGYASDLYDTALYGWRRHQKRTLADARVSRTETLWISPNTPTHFLPLA